MEEGLDSYPFTIQSRDKRRAFTRGTLTLIKGLNSSCVKKLIKTVVRP